MDKNELVEKEEACTEEELVNKYLDDIDVGKGLFMKHYKKLIALLYMILLTPIPLLIFEIKSVLMIGAPLYINLFSTLVVLIWYASIAVQLLFAAKLLKSYSKDKTPFRFEFAEQMGKASIAFLTEGFISIIILLIVGYLDLIFVSDFFLIICFTTYIFMIITGVILSFFSEVLYRGLKLQRESDETL